MSVKELKTENTLQQIAERIKKAKSIVIVTHMRPDGDALGSALALSTALNNLKIANQVCDETDIPSNLSFLNGLESVKKKPQGNYDLLIAVDCSDEQRMGALSEELFLAKKNRIDVINIDHHI